MAPGKALELINSLDPLRLRAVDQKGGKAPTPSTFPEAKAAAAAPVSIGTICTSLRLIPSFSRAKLRRKSSTTPSSTAIFLPFKSLIVLISSVTIILSFPDELSLTNTATSPLTASPAKAIVSLRV